MLFLPTLRSLWWFGSYSLRKAMVEFQENLEGWLEEATLFLNEPLEALFNLQDVVTQGKANDDLVQPVTGLPDFGLDEGWLDEMVCILDCPRSSLSLHNEVEPLMTEGAASILQSLVDTSFDTSSYLPLEHNNDSGEEFQHEFDLSFETGQAETISHSPSSSDPEPYSPISSLGSPTSTSDNGSQSDSSVSIRVYIPSDGNSEGPMYISYGNSEGPMYIPSDDNSKGPMYIPSDGNSEGPGEKRRVKPLKISKVISVDDLAINKLQSKPDKIPSVHVSLKPSSHPYASARPRRESKYERKKVQNKEAAARYRIKKRMEEKETADVVSDLECQQKELQEKHDQLAGEIKYLKALMQEMFKAKGVL